MSVQAMTRVTAHSEAAGITRFVLFMMANRAGGDHDVCFASVERIAYDCRCAHRTVQEAIRKLVTSGDLLPDGIHPKYRTNAYRVMPHMGVQEMHPPANERPSSAPELEVTGVKGSVVPQALGVTQALEPKSANATVTADQIYLAKRISETWDKHGNLTPAAVQKLNKLYGIVAVSDAMRQLHGFPPENALESAYAYVETICNLSRGA